MDPLLLGIDVGTSAVKAILTDVSGKERYWASSEYRHRAPRPGWAEQDPRDWWEAVVAAVRTLLEKAPSAAARVGAIGASGQGAAAVPLGPGGEPLRPAILWLDARSTAEADAMNGDAGPAGRFVAISGKRPAAYNVEPKLVWLRKHEPDVWSRIWKVTTTTGYVNYRLTGRPAMNHSDAGILLTYDVRRRGWSTELIGRLDFPASIYCDLAEGDEVIGALTSDAAAELGLPAGIPVVAGGEDTSSAGLAVGASAPGDAFLSLGTASTLYMATSDALVDGRLLTFPHVLPGMSLTGGSMAAGGGAMRWIAGVVGGAMGGFGDGAGEGLGERLRGGVGRGSTGGDSGGAPRSNPSPEGELFHTLTREAAGVPPGAGGLVFLPYLAGELQPVNDGAARGAFVGLGYDTSRAALVRAVMEGVAFAVRHNLTVLREIGAGVRSLRAVGGPTRNELWCQIIADVTGEEVTVFAEEGGAPLGDAVLAALGIGLIEKPDDMTARHVAVVRRHRPDEAARPVYDRLFEVYVSLYPRLKDLFPKLSGCG